MPYNISRLQVNNFMFWHRVVCELLLRPFGEECKASDLWPLTMNLTYKLDIDILAFDLYAKIQVCMSNHSSARVRQTHRQTHTMSKLLHHLQTQDVHIHLDWAGMMMLPAQSRASHTPIQYIIQGRSIQWHQAPYTASIHQYSVSVQHSMYSSLQQIVECSMSRVIPRSL